MQDIISYFISGQNSPRLPDMVSAVSTQTTITISWVFTIINDSRDETFTVMYKTSTGNLIASREVPSVPDESMNYSVQITVNPGITYFYQIISTNRFTTATDDIRNITTLESRKQYFTKQLINGQHFSQITESSPVTTVALDAVNSSTLVINWQPPSTPNGRILHYIVNIMSHGEGVSIRENTTTTTFTASKLSMFLSGVTAKLIIFHSRSWHPLQYQYLPCEFCWKGTNFYNY